MLEYFAYKKYKKNKAEKEGREHASSSPTSPTSPGAAPDSSSKRRSGTSTALASPLLNEDDERFLERLTSSSTAHDEDGGPRPPLPPRVKTPDLTWDSDSESFRRIVEGVDGRETANNKDKQISVKDKGKAAIDKVSLFIRSKTTNKKHDKLAVPSPEVEREEDDLTRVLEDLNLAARNNKAFALSAESNELVGKFTLVLKDLVNGVPTAVNDLTSLLEDKDGALSKNYEKLPKSMKKLVTQLPDKLSDSLAPELLAATAAAQGVSSKEAAAQGGMKGAAKRMLIPKNLKELITKPGAVVSMLKGIVNALKLRWPAFMGTNVIWSLALFLLLFVLWYCHKRGREVRLDKEEKEKTGTVDGSSRIEELPDDPALPDPGPGSSRTRTRSSGSGAGSHVVVEPPTPTTREHGDRDGGDGRRSSPRRRRSHRRRRSSESGSGEERRRRRD